MTCGVAMRHWLRTFNLLHGVRQNVARNERATTTPTSLSADQVALLWNPRAPDNVVTFPVDVHGSFDVTVLLFTSRPFE
jgi:hypothetical protein